DFDQRSNAGPARIDETFESFLNKDAVFLNERHDVGDRSKRNEVEVFAQIDAGIRTTLEQRVAGFENDADGAEAAEVAARIEDGRWRIDGAPIFRPPSSILAEFW